MRICCTVKNIDGMNMGRIYDKNKENNLVLKHGGLFPCKNAELGCFQEIAYSNLATEENLIKKPKSRWDFQRNLEGILQHERTSKNGNS